MNLPERYRSKRMIQVIDDTETRASYWIRLAQLAGDDEVADLMAYGLAAAEEDGTGALERKAEKPNVLKWFVILCFFLLGVIVGRMITLGDIENRRFRHNRSVRGEYASKWLDRRLLAQ